MDFSLTEEQRAVQATFHAFAEREIRPRAHALDSSAEFPRDLFLRAGELGFFGMRYPEPWGSGADLVAYLCAVEELAWGSLSVAASCAMQSLMGTYFVHRLAPPDVRDRLLPAAIRGEVVAAICMTEPDAGSDLLALTTRAERSGEAWRLTGAKTWVTSAPVADVFTVFARTGPKALGVFLVERGAHGLGVGRAIDKTGVRASPTSEVSFQDTPATCPLGDPERGTSYLREILAEVRLMTAALALGVARAAFEDALAYARERKQFGKPIVEHQAVAMRLAEMRVDLEASRRIVQWAAWQSRQPGAGTGPAGTGSETMMAKLFASEAALRICDGAARVLASYGFSRDFAVERYLRDVRFTLVGGGTSEILKINIAKALEP